LTRVRAGQKAGLTDQTGRRISAWGPKLRWRATGRCWICKRSWQSRRAVLDIFMSSLIRPTEAGGKNSSVVGEEKRVFVLRCV